MEQSSQTAEENEKVKKLPGKDDGSHDEAL